MGSELPAGQRFEHSQTRWTARRGQGKDSSASLRAPCSSELSRVKQTIVTKQLFMVNKIHPHCWLYCSFWYRKRYFPQHRFDTSSIWEQSWKLRVAHQVPTCLSRSPTQ